VVKEADSNIDYEPGVEMTIEVTKPLQWAGDAARPVLTGLNLKRPYRDWSCGSHSGPMRKDRQRHPT